MTYSGLVVWASPTATRETGVVPGDRVAIAGHDAGPRSLGRHQKYGGCASYAVAPHTAVRRIPDAWSFEQASCFAYGYDTAYHCLVENGQVQAGETILIHGATGGVGIPAVHIAKMLGLTIIATTRDAAKEGFLRSIGVHHVLHIDGGDSLGFHERVKALTDGKGADVCYDGVGGDAITVESMRALRFGGRLLIVGWAATPNVAKGKGERGAPNANRIPTNLIMMKSLVVKGCPAMIAARFDPTLVPRRVKALTEWILAGKLPPPVVSSVFPLSDIKAAFLCKVRSGSQVGSTVVIPPPLDLDFSSFISIKSKL
ncbi:MAG: zinc-binding dehydrogenase [archaeon]|nr:zinc-binding dehydrogenase [archaeon]